MLHNITVRAPASAVELRWEKENRHTITATVHISLNFPVRVRSRRDSAIPGDNSMLRDDAARQELMRAQLERILATPGLSPNTYEMVSKSLG